MHQFLQLSSVLASIAGLSSYSEPQNIEFRTAEFRSVDSLFFRVSSTIRLAAFQASGGAEP
jgi:hypothetical protein